MSRFFYLLPRSFDEFPEDLEPEDLDPEEELLPEDTPERLPPEEFLCDTAGADREEEDLPGDIIAPDLDGDWLL